MIRNVKLKLFLSNTVFKGISIINKIIPKNDNLVLLYSNMGFRDNVAYIYDYMVETGYNKKYRIIRSQNETCNQSIPDNVVVVSNLKAIFYYLRSGHIFYAFGKLPIYPSKNQKVVQMWHGSPFKGADKCQKGEMTKDYRKSYYTNALSTAECFTDFWGEEFDCGKQRISICGHPRTDVMINSYNKEELNLDCSKLILWMPTFRKSKILGYNDIESNDNILPIVQDADLQRLNDNLRANEVKLMIKLHPVQDTGNIAIKEHSNISLLSHKEFTQLGFDLYRLLGSVDALITDYSSVFYDFMLMDRPIAFTTDDYEEYKDNRGFAVSDPDYYRAGPKIQTINDLFMFIKDVADGNDTWKKTREKVNSEVNIFRDYRNCRRALEIGGVRYEENN